MKKFSVIIMALALVMGMTQCKKDNPAENGTDPILEGETVNITLTLGGSSNSKVDVNLNFTDQDEAPVSFEAGDVIWVVYNGKSCGKITCGSLSGTDQNGSSLGTYTFEGDITVPAQVGDQPLYFYFLGNKQPSFITDNNNAAIGYVVDLSDQTTELPVISYAPSVENFSTSTTNYTVKYNWLANQCALVKFSLENIYGSGTHMSTANSNDQNANALYTTDKCITLYGMDNQVTISFPASGTVVDPWTYDAQGNPHTSPLSSLFVWGQRAQAAGETYDGAIKLYMPAANEIASTETPDAVRYAIVAPKTGENAYNKTQENLDVAFNASSDPYGFFGTYKLAGEVVNNAFYQDAKIDLVWHSGAFRVASGQQVVFSRGNLQYAHRDAATADGGTWRFAKHQYDWVGGLVTGGVRQGSVVEDERDKDNTEYSNNEKIATEKYQGWIDLFGWGTGNDPMKSVTGNISGHYTDWYEWGEHNIINSGMPGSTNWWVTLRHDEWGYLFDDRTDGKSKVGAAQITSSSIGTINGLVILPDKWDGPSITPLNFTSLTWGTSGEFTDNKYTESTWLAMERYGAVFLPAAGYRNGTDFDGGTTTSQNRGCYWSSTQSTSAASWSFRYEGLTSSNAFSFTENYPMAPDNGHAVRLVHRLPTTTSKFFNKKD